MSENALYNLLVNDNKIAGLTVRRQHYADSANDYFLIDLAPVEGVVVSDYTLINHHLSVTASIKCEADLKSQYHYTATFRDKEGKTYRLHQYFDSRDHCVFAPKLEMETAAAYVSVNIDAYADQFSELAHKFSRSAVAALRANQRKKVALHLEEYEKLNAASEELSKNIKANKQQYVHALDLQITKLTELKAYANPQESNRYANVLRLLNRIKKAVEAMDNQPAATAAFNLDHKQALGTTKEVPQVERAFFEKSAAGASVAHKPVVKINFIAEIDKLKQHLDAIEAKIQAEKIAQATAAADNTTDSFALIGKFNQDLSDMEFQVDATQSLVEVTSLNTLMSLRRQIDKIAKTQLIAGLFAKVVDYKKLACLAGFYDLASANVLNIALTNNDALLIAFLLKNKMGSLHGPFNLKGKEYPTLADYYLSFEHALITPAIKDSLAVLVEHGVLMELDSKTQLPLAAILLMHPSHPLNDVLKKKADLTIYNPVFYRKLNNLLHLALLVPCSAEMKIKIQQLIEQNNFRITNGADLNKLDVSLHAEYKQTVGQDYMDRLSNHPKCKMLAQKERELGTKLLSKLNPGERRIYKAASKKAVEELNETLSAIQRINADLLPFDKFLENYLNSKKMKNESLELNIELKELAPVFKRGSHGKNARAYAAAVTRSNEIEQRLKVLGGLISHRSEIEMVKDFLKKNDQKTLAPVVDSKAKPANNGAAQSAVAPAAAMSAHDKAVREATLKMQELSRQFDSGALARTPENLNRAERLAESLCQGLFGESSTALGAKAGIKMPAPRGPNF